jgi:hypothetical protein
VVLAAEGVEVKTHFFVLFGRHELALGFQIITVGLVLGVHVHYLDF